jgi:hypothetical protein
MKRVVVMVLVLIGLALSSCKKDSDSSSVLQVKIQATNKSFSVLKSATLVTPSFTWDACTMNVTQIEFQAEGKQDENSQGAYQVSYEWQGSKVINLLNSASVIGDITLDPGIYDQVELQIHATKPQNSTSPVFYLAGNYTNANGTKIPVEITVNEDFQFGVEQQGKTLNGMYDYSALINLNLNLLMNGVLQAELDAAALTGGKMVISATSNSVLYQKIKTNILQCEDIQYDQDTN